jgi:hypothetical protein
MTKAIHVSLAVVFALAIGSGCSFMGRMPTGAVVTDIQAPMDSVAVHLSEKTDPKIPEKTGKATVASVLGLFAFGDASLTTAMKNAGITKVYRVDYESFSFLMFYSSFTVVVYGIGENEDLKKDKASTPPSVENKSRGAAIKDDKDKTYLDKLSGLTWQKADSGAKMSIAEADSYCGKAVSEGQPAWRLPNKSELEDLYKHIGQASKDLLTWSGSAYWSDSQVEGQAGYNWYVDFQTGESLSTYKSNQKYVRCVR